MSKENDNLSRRAMLGATGLTVAGGLGASTAAGIGTDEVRADHDEPGEDTPEECDGPGWNDTPKLPNSEWRVSDACRPEPPIVDPGEPEMDGTPPSDAEVLIGRAGCDEMDLSRWEHPDGGGAPQWNVTDDYVEVKPDTGFLQTKDDIGDAQIHVEWATPEEPEGENQHPGNSGVFLASRYEVQILNSYENSTYADGHAGAVYAQHPPLVNAARPPGEWQKYDIIWKAPRFSDGELESPATVTVFWNDVLVQNHTELIGPVQYKGIADYEPHPPAQPLQLQDHGQPVRFRNVWYRSLPQGTAEENE